MGHTVWGVTSQFPIFDSHRSSSVFLRVILNIVLVTRLTAALHAGSLVSCHNFLSLCLRYRRRSPSSSSSFSSERIILWVYSL
jgi:hypothetical protein